jgi:tetrahydromethanopterin S-methyltransferase subunit G
LLLQELEQLQRQIESKADQGQIEKRLDRMENKLDKLIEQQMK